MRMGRAGLQLRGVKQGSWVSGSAESPPAKASTIVLHACLAWLFIATAILSTALLRAVGSRQACHNAWCLCDQLLQPSKRHFLSEPVVARQWC